MPRSNKVYQLRISFDGLVPAVWRRITLPARTSLRRVHALIDEAFGLAGPGPYRFSQDGREWGRLEPGGDYIEDDSRFTLAYCLPSLGHTLAYRSGPRPMTIVLEAVLP